MDDFSIAIKTIMIDKRTYLLRDTLGKEFVNCYLILGDERALLIDTGFGISNILSIVTELTSLPISVVNSHVHYDHVGGNKLFGTAMIHKNEQIVCEREGKWLESLGLSKIQKYLSPFAQNYDISDYRPYDWSTQLITSTTFEFELGNRSILAIHTPGHSPGHLCFVDKSGGALFSGDFIYRGFHLLNLSHSDPLLYFESLVMIKGWGPFEKIYPGHNEPILDRSFIPRLESNLRSRIQRNEFIQSSGIHQFEEYTFLL